MQCCGRDVERLLGRIPPVLVVFAVWLGVIGTADAAEMKKKHWYGSLWPLGEHVEVETLKDEVVKFKSGGEIPFRPALFFELGDPFLDTGPLDAGFEVPIIGAIWQPRLWSSFIPRTTVQPFANRAPGRPRDPALATRLHFFDHRPPP